MLSILAGSEFLGAKSSLDRVPSATMDAFDGRLAFQLFVETASLSS